MKITPELSEISGIHSGDGHLRRDKELEISGSFEEKEYYDTRVIPLFNNFFNLSIKGRFFTSKGTYGFWVVNKEIGNTLKEIGFPSGNKTKTVKVPNIILKSNNSSIRRSFLRGLFDTDGCMSFNKRIYNKNHFKKTKNFYPTILIVSISKNLIKGVDLLCKKEGFESKVYLHIPKKKTENIRYIMQISGEKSLLDWMEKISPKNQIKVSRFKVWEKFGHCPSKATYKERLEILKSQQIKDFL
ncbi:hypothetical protein HYV89_00310 [Candidatus Woesearchaeota archaeon]|nr:hypothetical protein [Candidatus Woesearchaeota archaeon]